MKQVLIAVLTIVVALSLAVAGTYAGFSDIENSEGNFYETGSLDLQLADHAEDFGYQGDSVTQTWHYSDLYPAGMAPGDFLERVVYLKNTGNLAGDHLDISCHIVNEEIDNDTDAENLAESTILGDDVSVAPGFGIFDKDTVMIVNYMKYQNAGTVDVVWNDGTQWDILYMDDVDGDGMITLFDFSNHAVTNLSPPVSGLSNFSMKVTFGDASWNLNEYQGDRTQMVLVFTIFQ
ncbi:MAG TPA: hypothetical protein G4O07_07835 [Dehalococcoidia bacterium]|nr:hypothetical protein [Dehalococcoidia bacterium]